MTPAGQYRYCSMTSSASKTQADFIDIASGTYTVFPTCQHVLIRVESADVRWTDDGTAPTASLGMPLLDGESFYYSGTPSALKFIGQTSTTAKVHLTFYN